MTTPVLDRYEIRSELGQGGMSVVYRARDRQLPRDVAVKVLHGFLAKQEDARQRFHREAVAVAKLHHPGIVEIFDYSGPDAPETYIVTELINGTTLRDFFEKHGPFPHPEMGALIIAELCRPLAHAHQQGVIHRDLKPENVMVTLDGHLKLMDFGIAQIQDGQKLTLTGTLLGSPAHMAPEVIDGERPDARADIFSLGTMLYWLAVGKLPFQAPNPSALFRRILEGQYDDPQELEPRIGNGLAKIIRRALEPIRDARYASVLELKADLENELLSVALTPAETKVRELLVDPKAFAEAARPELIRALMEGARGALRARGYARALDRVNRVLAIEPGHLEARALAKSVGSRTALTQRKKAVAGVLASAALAAGVAYAWWFGPGPSSEARPVDLPRPTPGVALAQTPTTALRPSPPITSPAVSERPTPSASESPAPRPSASLATKASPRPSGKPDPRSSASPSAATPSSPPSPSAASSATPSPSAASSATPSPSPSETARPAVSEGPRPVSASLRLKVGNSFADVAIDGVVVEHDFYVGSVSLSPGKHVLTVEKPGFGRFLPRNLEVDAAGQIFELRPDGRHPVRGELLFAVPKQGMSAPPDWQPIR